MRIITRVVLLAAAVGLFAYSLYACGGGGAARGGDIAVQLTYPGSSGADASMASAPGLSDDSVSHAPVATSYPLDPSNRILIRVLGPDFAPMEAWFNRSQGRGVIKNVPPGSKIVVEVDEYDSSAVTLGTSATLLGRGWVQDITLAEGEAKTVDVAMHARGTILTICGAQAVNGLGTQGDSGDGGLAVDARISSPWAVKVGPDDSIYISNGNRKVKRIDRYGYISHFAGDGSSAPVTVPGIAAASAPVGNVHDIDFDPSGNVYLATYYSLVDRSQILKITDGIISKIVYDVVTIRSIGNLAVVNENELFFVNSGPRIYQIVGSSINEFVRYDTPPSTSEPFDRLHYLIRNPSAITYASKSNSLVFSEYDNNRIMELNLAGDDIRFLVGNDANSGSFYEGVDPRFMALDRPQVVEYNPVTGKIFFVEVGSSRVLYITPDDVVQTFAGDGNPGFSGDGSRSDKAQLDGWPRGVSVDSRGNVYIADYGNHAIRMVVGGALGELPP